MKSLGVLVTVAVLLMIGFFAWRGNKSPGAVGTIATRGESGTGSSAVLGVEAFMKNVDAHRGPVRVRGVVSAVDAATRTLALIDSAEFEKCQVTSCAELALPVRWTGPMPAVEETVEVEGQAEEDGGKLVFVATKVETVSSPKGGPE